MSASEASTLEASPLQVLTARCMGLYLPVPGVALAGAHIPADFEARLALFRKLLVGLSARPGAGLWLGRFDVEVCMAKFLNVQRVKGGCHS